MPLKEARTLVIGYGNPGRGDDGLGPALAREVESLGLAGVTVEIDYQLTVDHARLIADHDRVVFADAHTALATPYAFAQISGAEPLGLGSHQVSPEAALTLAGLLFGHKPPGWMLAISGSEFGEVKEGLSALARDHLAAASAFVADWLRRPPQQ